MNDWQIICEANDMSRPEVYECPLTHSAAPQLFTSCLAWHYFRLVCYLLIVYISTLSCFRISAFWYILGCLVISHFCKFWYFKILFNIRFSRYKLGFSPSWLKSLSVIRNRNLFHSLITGKNQLYLYETSRPCELKVVFKGIWQPPALPYRLQYSTIGRLGLNHRVRDENGCVP